MTDEPVRILEIPEDQLTAEQEKVFDDLLGEAAAYALQDLDLFAEARGGHGDHRYVPEQTRRADLTRSACFGLGVRKRQRQSAFRSYCNPDDPGAS